MPVRTCWRREAKHRWCCNHYRQTMWLTNKDTNTVNNGGSTPSDRRGGWGAVSKKIFSALRASFCSKNNGGRAPGPPPLDPPLDCYHSPSGLSRGRACYVRASAFALRADKKHAHPRDSDGLLIFHHRLLRLVTKK